MTRVRWCSRSSSTSNHKHRGWTRSRGARCSPTSYGSLSGLAYFAEVRIVDARGKEYKSVIPEWWRE